MQGTVLIIDDAIDMAAFLVEMLRRRGFDASAVHSARAYREPRAKQRVIVNDHDVNGAGLVHAARGAMKGRHARSTSHRGVLPQDSP